MSLEAELSGECKVNSTAIVGKSKPNVWIQTSQFKESFEDNSNEFGNPENKKIYRPAN